MPKKRKSPEERFISFVNYNGQVSPFTPDASRCHEWKGNKDSWGYGLFWLNGKPVLAHRFSCEVMAGRPIPKGLEAAHVCGVSFCVNHNHIRYLTHSENIKEGWRHKNSHLIRPDIFPAPAQEAAR